MTESEKIVMEAIEFKEKCDLFLNKLQCKKSYLAKLLGVSQSYLSRLYRGKEKVTHEMLGKITNFCEDQNILKDKNYLHQENLPSIPNRSREDEISKRNYEAEILRAFNHLSERITDLEKDLKRTKDDSEKKIRAIVVETIRDEAERIADRAPRYRTVANDE